MASQRLDSTYGAMLIGVFTSIFFQGILSVQTYIYYENYADDSWRLKAFVAALWSVDFVHLVLICVATYRYLIHDWGNDAALLQESTALNLHLVFLSISTLACQGFFLYRVWRFSRNTIVTAILAAACLTSAILNIYLSVQDIEHITSPYCTAEILAAFATGAAADVLISLILCWYLHREMTMSDRVNSLIKRVIWYTLATGLATSVLAMSALIAYVVWPDTFISLALNFSLGRMYTNALLATLNSRKHLRARLAPPIASKWSRISVSVPAFDDETSIPQNETAMKDYRLEIGSFGERHLTVMTDDPA
ncbi:ANK-REP-REGION domain-containing protein [Mycena sanguinolenta]|uniref:ANK-REP-REGION domain-containing protein n=1 Tax=Mycena sanguinolenta TaxID=230812 RepID=A0A8H6X3C6_9AGAR|nr:ANK-REP-REGION domain-containing protein [Mycena sanguinolenta]